MNNIAIGMVLAVFSFTIVAIWLIRMSAVPKKSMPTTSLGTDGVTVNKSSKPLIPSWKTVLKVLLIAFCLVVLILVAIKFGWLQYAFVWLLQFWPTINSGEFIWWGVVILIFSLLFAEKVIPKKWSYVPAALGAILIVTGVYTSGFATWASRVYENTVERCLGDGICIDEQAEKVAPNKTVAESIRANDNGETHFIIAPWDKEVTLIYPTDKCVYYWTKAASDPYDVATKAIPRWSDGVAARIFVSNTGKPEKVYYQVGNRKFGECPPSI